VHLVAAGTLADERPELAWRHARAARSKGGRIAVVRETVGLVAYRAGEWSEAISELRAARRMGGGPGHLAVMADCERALQHPEKAIELSRSAEADQLDEDGAIEMTIVVAGARSDLGQLDAALVLLEESGVRDEDADARLLYAYADLLAGAGRRAEALEWFMKAYDADAGEDTDAAERIAELADAGDHVPADSSAAGGTEPPIRTAPLSSGRESPAGEDESAGPHRQSPPVRGSTSTGDPPDRS
jgi:tetratricopeptide (TPR) repeat protein